MHVDLGSIGGGALQERFDREFEKVVKNMKDPNTSYKEARKVVVTLTLRQDEDRNTSVCTCEVQSKLAKARSFDTNFGIGRDLKTDQYFVKEYGTQIPGQMNIEDVERAAENKKDAGANLQGFPQNKIARAF